MLSQVVLALPCCLITGSGEEKFMNLRAAAAGMRLGTQSNAARLYVYETICAVQSCAFGAANAAAAGPRSL